jgi:hypothetical protein
MTEELEGDGARFLQFPGRVRDRPRELTDLIRWSPGMADALDAMCERWGGCTREQLIHAAIAYFSWTLREDEAGTTLLAIREELTETEHAVLGRLKVTDFAPKPRPGGDDERPRVV